MPANYGLKLTDRLFLAERPQLSRNVSRSLKKEREGKRANAQLTGNCWCRSLEPLPRFVLFAYDVDRSWIGEDP